MDKYKVTIGLEIHAELKTKTKMFCGCANDRDEEEPNKNICPVCMGHPGTLPLLNEEAIKSVLKVGVALGGQLADFTEWDRKNYFYPDIPKGYQISQYKYPLISGGELKGVKITRIHLEEDTGTSLHEEGDYSLVDFNRAGVPLMELVTEPVIHDAKTAGDFGRELQLLLRYLDVSDANMEKGEMRVEANISISKTEKLGTKVEVKNLNSFRAVERAIEFEIKRQEGLLENGGVVVQETRGWDENKQTTFSQRKKEESHDYRYFPEPDLPKMILSELSWANKDFIKKSLPELPDEKRLRYTKDLGVKKEDAEIYVTDLELRSFFEEVVKAFGKEKKFVSLASNYIVSDIVGIRKNGTSINKLTPNNFSKLISMIGEEKLSSRGGKDVLLKMIESGEEPQKIAKELGAMQVIDSSLIETSVRKVIENNPVVVADYKGGKKTAIQFLVGQVMKETKGSAKPDITRKILEDLLK
jgi:aspartyl-tRNA(Asn)/glutamyl-tRNA(Gln) amidotransferase subunit B